MFHRFYVTDGEAEAVFLYVSYYLETCSPVSFQGLRRPINSLSSLVPDVCSTVQCGFGTKEPNRHVEINVWHRISPPFIGHWSGYVVNKDHSSI